MGGSKVRNKVGMRASARWCSAAVLVVAASALVAGCAEDDAGGAGADAVPASDHYPVTVENCGREITFEQAPSRVYLGYQSAAELFFGLGLGDRAMWQIQPADPPLTEQEADFERVPDKSPDPYVPVGREEMLSLGPDFYFAYVNSEYGGPDQLAPGLATLEDFDKIGANVYALVCPDEDPIKIDFTYRAITDLGLIFDMEDEAAALIEDIQARLADVQERVAGSDPVPVFFYYGGEAPMGTWGQGSYLDQMIELAGGENVFGETSGGRRGYLQLSKEEVVNTAPEYFLINGTATDDNDVEAKAQYLFDTFPDMPASQDERFGITYDTANTPGWRFVDIVEDLARDLHPEAFEDVPEDGSTE